MINMGVIWLLVFLKVSAPKDPRQKSINAKPIGVLDDVAKLPDQSGGQYRAAGQFDGAVYGAGYPV